MRILTTPIFGAPLTPEMVARIEAVPGVHVTQISRDGLTHADADAVLAEAEILLRGQIAALPLKGVIDLSAEKARLDKEMAKAEADIKRVDAKLANEKFVANAPEEIVEEEKEKREEALARKAKILEALERLRNAS